MKCTEVASPFLVERKEHRCSCFPTQCAPHEVLLNPVVHVNISLFTGVLVYSCACPSHPVSSLCFLESVCDWWVAAGVNEAKVWVRSLQGPVNFTLLHCPGLHPATLVGACACDLGEGHTNRKEGVAEHKWLHMLTPPLLEKQQCPIIPLPSAKVHTGLL